MLGKPNYVTREEYVTPFGGGAFFALPGVPDERSWLGQGLLA